MVNKVSQQLEDMKLPEPLTREDAGILRNYAIPYFKERYTEYSRLNLSLREDELLINCDKDDSLYQLIREIWKIRRKASLAIGISCVNLEFNGQKILKAEEQEIMVATLEQMEQIDNNYELLENIEIPKAPVTPKAVRLIPLSEVVASSGVASAIAVNDLIVSLDEETQDYYKNQNREQVLAIAKMLKINTQALDQVQRIIPLYDINNQYSINAEDKHSALLWYHIWNIPRQAKSVMDSLKAAMPQFMAETSAATASSSTETTSRKRGRKPKTEETATERTTEKVKTVRFVNTLGNDKKFVEAIAKNKFRVAANKILKSLGDRKDEFLSLAMDIDPTVRRYLNNVLTNKAMFPAEEYPKSRRETIESKLIGEFQKMVESSPPNNGTSGNDDNIESDF